MAEKWCIECRIIFEPKTVAITWGGYAYHLGCFEAMKRQGRIVTETRCSHYTPAEDSSKWAFAHRTWGCPDQGAVWPNEWAELAMHD